MFIASEDICFILIENILLIDKSREGEREIGERERPIERVAKRETRRSSASTCFVEIF